MSIARQYLRGTIVYCEATFEVNSVKGDPDEVTFYLRPPDGVLRTYVHDTDDELQQDSTGVFYVAVDSEALGDGPYSWDLVGEGGDYAGSTSGAFRVNSRTTRA